MTKHFTIKVFMSALVKMGHMLKCDVPRKDDM